MNTTKTQHIIALWLPFQCCKIISIDFRSSME